MSFQTSYTQSNGGSNGQSASLGSSMTNGYHNDADAIPSNAAKKELGQGRPIVYYWLDVRQTGEDFKDVTECLSITFNGRTWKATGGHTTALEADLRCRRDQPLTDDEIDQVMRWSSDMYPAPERHL